MSKGFKNCQKIQVLGGLGQVIGEKLFSEAIVDQMFETKKFNIKFLVAFY